MMTTTLNIGSVDQVQTHCMWPFMAPVEPCGKCLGSHPTFEEKPDDCRQPGAPRRTRQQVPAGYHLFSDKFQGNEITQWIMSIVTDPTKAIHGHY